MTLPEVELFWHAEGTMSATDKSWLERGFQEALRYVHTRWPNSVLGELSELEVSVVDEQTLAKIHGDFCEDPSATDVITFPHGEILASVDAATSRAEEFRKDEKGELLLYLIHGLLHLAGFDDREEEERKLMHETQEVIWQELTSQCL